MSIIGQFPGIGLPQLTNEGADVDLASGKQLINASGKVVNGVSAFIGPGMYIGESLEPVTVYGSQQSIKAVFPINDVSNMNPYRFIFVQTDSQDITGIGIYYTALAPGEGYYDIYPCKKKEDPWTETVTLKAYIPDPR